MLRLNRLNGQKASKMGRYMRQMSRQFINFAPMRNQASESTRRFNNFAPRQNTQLVQTNKLINQHKNIRQPTSTHPAHSHNSLLPRQSSVEKIARRDLHVGIVGCSMGGLTIANYLAQSSNLINISLFEKRDLPTDPLEMRRLRAHQTILTVESLESIKKIQSPYRPRSSNMPSPVSQIFDSGCFVEGLARADFTTGISLGEKRSLGAQAIPQMLWAHSGIIKGTLLRELCFQPNVRIFDACKVIKVAKKQGPQSGDSAKLELTYTDEQTAEDHFVLECDLLIACDGPHSQLRSKVQPRAGPSESQRLLYCDGLMNVPQTVKEQEEEASSSHKTSTFPPSHFESFNQRGGLSSSGSGGGSRRSNIPKAADPFPKKIINNLIQQSPFRSVSFLRLDSSFVAWAAEIETTDPTISHKEISPIEDIIEKMGPLAKQIKSTLLKNNKAGLCTSLTYLPSQDFLEFAKDGVFFLGNSAHPHVPSLEQASNLAFEESFYLGDLLLNLASQRTLLNVSPAEIAKCEETYSKFVKEKLQQLQQELPQNQQQLKAKQQDYASMHQVVDQKPQIKFF